jgi:ComF family protein
MAFARSILAMVASRARDVEALAMPRACLGCERPMPPGDASACCALCRHRMRAIAPPVCARCAQPLSAWSLKLTAAGGACGFCREWPRELAWTASAVWLEDGPARNLVHALKYGGWRIAAPAMAARTAAAAAAGLRGLDALVPVPLGRTRERERGHNQAALLAAALGRLAGVPVARDALRRVRETRSQTRLAPAERRRNVAGAFAAGTAALAGRRVALVDDVLTTGATLGAAAQALAALGPASIGAVTFARALVPA